MTRPGLTDRERQLFDIVRDELVAGRSPSYDELCTALKLRSKSSICRLADQLQSKGYLARMRGRARAFALAPGADSYTVHLERDLDIRLREHVAACRSMGETTSPEIVIAEALRVHLRRPS